MRPHERNESALEAMAADDLEKPVVMLNLLRYRDRAKEGFGVDGMTGREAYEEYGRRFAEMSRTSHGGEPIWMGRAHRSIVGEEDWDVVMANDPKYQSIAPIRAAALADSRLVEMTQLLPKSVTAFGSSP